MQTASPVRASHLPSYSDWLGSEHVTREMALGVDGRTPPPPVGLLSSQDASLELLAPPCPPRERPREEELA